jgi:hypothetical protein
MDFLICQTSAASPAEPGELLFWFRGQNIMKTRLVPPRRARRAKDRVERAKLLIAAVRHRAGPWQCRNPDLQANADYCMIQPPPNQQ